MSTTRDLILEAPISHEQNCCGCWVIWREPNKLYAQCNECGETRDVLKFLSEPKKET